MNTQLALTLPPADAPPAYALWLSTQTVTHRCELTDDNTICDGPAEWVGRDLWEVWQSEQIRGYREERVTK